MLEILTSEEMSTGTAAKRTAIDAELRNDPNRSDREIARIVGCDHKTVGARRADMRSISPPSSPNAPSLVIDAAPSIARGLVSLPSEEELQERYDPFAPGSEDLVIPHQPAIAVYENTSGAVVIRQAGDNDDVVILVRPEQVDRLAKRLREVAEEAMR
jgi:hypothetical protein